MDRPDTDSRERIPPAERAVTRDDGPATQSHVDRPRDLLPGRFTSTNTAFALLARFESPTVKLEEISEEYFGLRKEKAYQRAALNRLPIPTFRAAGSQKAPRLVHMEDLARWLDGQRARARVEWRRCRI